MTGHCKDCKWWGLGSTPGPCRHPLNNPRGGVVQQKESGMTFHYSDCADDGKHIITGPMFGCVHFAPFTPINLPQLNGKITNLEGDGQYIYPHDIPGDKVSEK